MAKGRFAFASAPERSLALGEVHARPTVLLAPSRIIVQLAFMMDGGSAVHHSVIAEMSRSRGVAPPERDARHHAMPWGRARCAGSGIPNSRHGSGMAPRRKNSAVILSATRSATVFHHPAP